jgi:hypothetical protein
LDTPLIWIIYVLMGAELHSSTKLNAFIGEFDLVKVEEGASVEHQIRCRKFGSAQGEGRSTMRFRSICVGKHITGLGMLSPGVSVEDSAIIERRSVLPEGVLQVPDGVVAGGNPAFKSGIAPLSGWSLGSLKVLWLVFELYIFFGLLLIAQIMFQDRLPSDWAYTPLCFWSLLITTQIILSMVVGIILKWILILHRTTPGPYCVNSLWRKFAGWAAD